MALKLLSKLRNQNLQITRNRNHHRLLDAARFFSEQPVSNLSTPDDSKFIIKNKQQTTTSSLKQHELAKFAAISDTWWDSEGPFKPLHNMNPTRLAFIRSTLCRHFSKDPNCARPFEGLKIVDVGCGGGILSEPLARMGATVTGVDAVEKNINVARIHAVNVKAHKKELLHASANSLSNPEIDVNLYLLGGGCETGEGFGYFGAELSAPTLAYDLDPETSTIEYCCTTAEKLVEEQRKFDAVIALEVLSLSLSHTHTHTHRTLSMPCIELSLNLELLPKCQMLHHEASYLAEVAGIIERLYSASLMKKVIEHVAAPAEFCKSLAALAYPGGATVISTINRSMRAYATAIVAAEYLLHWQRTLCLGISSACNLLIAVVGGGGGVKVLVFPKLLELPKGTHQWSSFLTPEELVLILQRASINVKEMAGFVYSPLTGRWSLSDDISVNFIAYGTKDGQ
ncbi:hypothetical protein POTOM_046633 [Populus tomentosa]|uniref:Ubiquinone biosynthesis O-methyltransferase, mitochondrial n=1 Tax=Populus tomentosa TaxID=118781 RepID=A0A8X7YF24_POPTO|nr:hypothetical protein POTOM_046633 [Populus tomentosa]